MPSGSQSKLSSPLLPIFLIVLVDVMGLTMILPLLPFYAERYGASPAVVGLLSTTYALCQLVSGPFLGQLSDTMGRRPLLLVSQAGTFIGFLILANANALWLIFLSRFIDGITAGNLSLAQAYISDVTEPKNRAKAFGIIGISFGLGFLIGPAISGFLSQYGIQYSIYAAAGLSAASILATYFLLPTVTVQKPAESEGRKLAILNWRGYQKYFEQPPLRALLCQFFCFCFSFATFISGFALFAERRYLFHGRPFGPKEVGYVFACSGLLGIIVQGGLIGKLVHHLGEKKLAALGFSCSAFGYLALGFTHTLPGLAIAGLTSSFGSGVVRPALTSAITRSVSRHHQGVILGLNQSLQSVALIIAPLIAGFLIDRHWLGPWAWVAAVVSALGLYIGLRFLKVPLEPVVS